MIEKIKRIDNPLTIIAFFAAIAEVSATISLGLVGPELQKIFIWFVMLFPALLVICFFITLNFNPKVIYSPSDFKNEENFLITWNKYKINVPDGSFTEISEAIEKQYNLITKKEKKDVYFDEFKVYADSLFSKFVKNLDGKIDRKYIAAINFGPQLKGFYILSVNFSPKYIPNGVFSHMDYLIHIRKVGKEVVGSAAGITKETSDFDTMTNDIIKHLKRATQICINNEKGITEDRAKK
ncbi:MAG: hypothetical protein FWF35_02130 [Elusimicrobia bacterium]|nr:hypothetical protein [Elusimicrobiota bacterium]